LQAGGGRRLCVAELGARLVPMVGVPAFGAALFLPQLVGALPYPVFPICVHGRLPCVKTKPWNNRRRNMFLTWLIPQISIRLAGLQGPSGRCRGDCSLAWPKVNA
jgi:hypothetical protein